MEKITTEVVVWISRQKAGALLPDNVYEHTMESGAVLKKPRPMSKGKKGMKVELQGTTAQVVDAVAELMKTDAAQGSELDQWNYYKESKDGQEKYGPFTAAKLHSWDLDGWFKDMDNFVVEHQASGVWLPPAWMWLWYSTHFTLDVEMEDVEEQVLHEIAELRHDLSMQEEVHQVVDMDIDVSSIPAAVSNITESPLPNMSDYILHAASTEARREVLLVIDTNILLAPKPFALLNAINTLLGPGAHRARVRVVAVIPYMVLMELDKLKARQSKPDLQTSARLALIELRNHLGEQNSFFKVQSMQEFKEASTAHALPVPDKEVSADDRILQCCLQLTDRVKTAAAGDPVADKVVLLSNDTALCTKAQASDVKAVISKQIPASPVRLFKFFNDLVGLDDSVSKAAPKAPALFNPQAVAKKGASSNGTHPAVPVTVGQHANNGGPANVEVIVDQLLLQLLLLLYGQVAPSSGHLPDVGLPPWQARPLQRLFTLLQTPRLQGALQQLDAQCQQRQQAQLNPHQAATQPAAQPAAQPHEMQWQQSQSNPPKDLRWQEQTRRELLAQEQQLREKLQAQQAQQAQHVQQRQMNQMNQMNQMMSDRWQQEHMMFTAARRQDQQPGGTQELTTALSGASSQGGDGAMLTEGSLGSNSATDAAAMQAARQQAAVNNYMAGAFLSQFSQSAPNASNVDYSGSSNLAAESTSTVLNRQLSARRAAATQDPTQGPGSASFHPSLTALQNNQAAFFQGFSASQRSNPSTPTAAQGNPTFNPPSNPSLNPTSNPSFNPPSNPAFNPTSNPSFNPPSNPTFNPTSNASFNPPCNPSFNPTSNPATNRSSPFVMQGPQPGSAAGLHLSMEAMKMLQNIQANTQHAMNNTTGQSHRAGGPAGMPQVTLETLQALQALQRQGSGQHPSPHSLPPGTAGVDPRQVALQALQAHAAQATQAANVQRTPSGSNIAEGGLPLEALRALQGLQLTSSSGLQRGPSTPTKPTPMEVISSPKQQQREQQHMGSQLLQPNKQNQAGVAGHTAGHAAPAPQHSVLDNLADLVSRNHSSHGGVEGKRWVKPGHMSGASNTSNLSSNAGMGPSRQQAHSAGYDAWEEEEEEDDKGDWLSRISAGTARGDDVQQMMGELIVKVHDDVEGMLKEEFEDLWEDVVVEKPPWSARSLLFVLQKHWDCFKGRLGTTTQPTVVNLYQVLKKVPNEGSRSVSKAMCEDLLQHTSELLKAFGKDPPGSL